jgi:hypothetical protein
VCTLFLAPLAVGILGGYAVGGRLGNLLRTRIRAVWLLFLAAGLQYLHFEMAATRARIEDALGFSLMVAIFGLVAVWLVVNLYRRRLAFNLAIVAILVGGAMNALAIAANGRMPFSEPAVRGARVSADQQARGDRSPKHLAADGDTRLLWLGDIIAVAPIQKVVSIGDIVLLTGVAGLLTATMQDPRAGRRRMAQPVAAATTG